MKRKGPGAEVLKEFDREWHQLNAAPEGQSGGYPEGERNPLSAMASKIAMNAYEDASDSSQEDLSFGSGSTDGKNAYGA